MNSTKLIVLAAVAVAALLSLDSRRRDGVEWEIEEDRLELIPVDSGAAGPESVAFDERGEGPYTGVSDGRVLKWQAKERRWLEYSTSSPQLLDQCRGSRDPRKEEKCGRPLGLKFNDRMGALYIADAYFGLQVVEMGDNASRPVVSETQGISFGFTNGLEIDQQTGVIYFTDSSTNFHRRDFMKAIISGDKSGRLLKYDPENNQVEVLVDGLSFPNGLAISKDGSFLFLAETTTCRILKYWIQTPKGSTLEEVAQLDWFPDNIKISSRGGFWVGLHSKRGKLVQWAFSYTWLRKVLFMLPLRFLLRVSSFLNRFTHQVIAVRLSEDGKIVEATRADARRKLKFISEVEERNGSLWIGSVVSPFLGLYHL